MNARIILIPAFALIAACGGGGGSSSGPPPVPSGFLYVNAYGGPNTVPTAIYGLTVYSNGTLSLVPGTPAPAEDGGGGPLDLDVLSDEQSVLGLTGDHQQAQAQDPGARAARSAALQNSNGLEPTNGTLSTQLLGFVGSLSLQALQVLRSHVARDVFPRKA